MNAINVTIVIKLRNFVIDRGSSCRIHNTTPRAIILPTFKRKKQIKLRSHRRNDKLVSLHIACIFSPI